MSSAGRSEDKGSTKLRSQVEKEFLWVETSSKTVVQENGFLYGESRLQQNRTISDHCVFVTKVSADDFIILLLYVDDILIVSHDASKIEKLKRELRSLKPLVTIVT